MKNLKTKKILLSTFIVLFSVVCVTCTDAKISTKKFLTIKMVGELKAPANAEGNTDPKWQEYSLEGVTIDPDPETGEALALYEGEPTSFKIVSRPQIIFQKEIPDEWVGETFTSLVAKFNKTVVLAGKYESDYEIQFPTLDITNSSEFTIEKGQGLTVTISVAWKNTIKRDDDAATEEVGLPELTMTMEAD